MTQQRRAVVGFDTETTLITPDQPVPDFICATFYGDAGTRHLFEYAAAERNTLAKRDPKTGRWWVLTTDECVAGGLYLRATDADAVLVAHNLAFDALVLERTGFPRLVDIFHDVAVGRLTCTKVRETLLAIAHDNLDYDTRIGKKHGFGLRDLVEVYYGAESAALLDEDKAVATWNWETGQHDIKGNANSWRLRYAELRDVPVESWPERAVHYAVEDAEWAYLCYHKQAAPQQLPEGVLVDEAGVVTDEVPQVRASIDLALIGAVGVPTDEAAVDAFAEAVRAEVAKVDAVARRMGFLTVNKCKECFGTGLLGDIPTLLPCRTCNGDPNYLPPRARVPLEKPTKNTARLQGWVSYAYGYAPPMTAPSEKFPHGQVKTDEDTLLSSGHDGLREYAESLSAKKLESTYVPILRRGVNGRVHPRFNVLVKSGRTSCRDPNYQNPPRVAGFRECHVAPEGLVYASLDYATVELRTWAQTCLDMFGFSALADAFNEGFDPHLAFGLDLLAAETGRVIPYAVAVEILKDKTHPDYAAIKDKRQLAKIANFGFPGGLGVSAFVDYCRGYGVIITVDQSQFLKDRWRAMWPEADAFFAWIGQQSDIAGRDNTFRLVQPFSGRLRGGCTYTSGANTLFQGPAADGLKRAVAALHDAMYCQEDSILDGVRVWNVIHDEVLLVGPEWSAAYWAEEASRIMETAMQAVTPDIPQIAEPALMRRWDKDAWCYYNEDGLLAPFEDDPAYKKKG